MEHEHLKKFSDTEHLFSGNLTLGEQKKEGTQISFKDKNRRYFVLRCLSQKLLTMSGYKNLKEYKAPSGNHHKTVEQIVVSQHAKIHSMQLPSKKHKKSYVLCIIQDKQTVYLEADTSEDLTAWWGAFNDICIRLGWKQPPSSPPLSPLTPPLNGSGAAPLPPESYRPDSFPQYSPNEQSQDRRKVRSSGSAKGNVFDLFQPPEVHSQRYSSTPMNVLSGATTASGFYSDHPRNTEVELGLDAGSTTGITDPNRYAIMANVPHVPDQHAHAWLENTQSHQERVINVGYINLGGDANLGQMVHPGPPALPPRPQMHRRGNTFPGANLTLPQSEASSPNQSPRNSGDFQDVSGPVRSSSEHAPKISVTKPPMSPLTHHQRFQHLFEDSENNSRKVSLPQPLNSKQRRLGIVTPPAHMSVSPPDSPVQMRKAGSYTNVSLNLSNRPLPSPVHGDSFDMHTLRWEMGHSDGFPVVLDKSELQDALGLVRIADYVWVAGWKAGNSEIANKLHVGDQLRQINEQIVVDPAVTNTLFATSAVNEILLIIRRLPHAKVRNLHRSSTNESWGLDVEGNRILNVSKSGPAAEAKLATRAQGAFSERLCDWIITEINGEPVSLLSKRDQVKNRMTNAGLQMTLVIQPDDFIKRLNAELQKVKFAHEYFVGSESQD